MSKIQIVKPIRNGLTPRSANAIRNDALYETLRERGLATATLTQLRVVTGI
ncbi:hypothetical protein [Nostoc sp. UHCC 0251]|uniref:hypothetical protein n=1 Tax=Nostoc sp. UHCC 0251 TaxID=3110240 RepID=UPI002B209388|nr:hypothetical protein [Nostoc sp. UHCC 0251]